MPSRATSGVAYNRQRQTWVVLLLVFLILPACTQAPDCSRPNLFCAALVTDTRGLNDFGANHEAWVGLQQSQAAGVVDQIAYIESVDARDYEKNIAFFVDAGYDVIITSGVGLQDATLHHADLASASVFVGIHQADDAARTNFVPITFAEDQLGFLAGALAVHLTDTKIIGAVCETSGIDAMWRYCEGFRAGARYVDDTVKVVTAYRENESSSKLFIDAEWGFTHAQDLIHNGADVIFAVGGETGVGALRAANEAKVTAIGAERDQSVALAGEGVSVVTSVLGQISFTVEGVMRRIRAGDFSDGRVNPIGFVNLGAVVQPEVVAALDEILQGLLNGVIKTGVLLAKP